MEKKLACFPVRVTKAYVDPSTGKRIIEAIASDDRLDYYRERFAKEALASMVLASKERKTLKPDEGKVELQETHRESFAFGFTVDGELVTNDETGATEYKAIMALKDGWPQGDELFKDIVENKVDKQLSVGGYVPDWKTGYGYEVDTFTAEDGSEIEVTVGIIKEFVLEHIAVTPPDGAANPRTQFLTAKDAPLGFQGGYVFRSVEGGFREYGSEPTGSFKDCLGDIVKLVKDAVKEVFAEKEADRMTNLEKAKKMKEDFQKLIEGNPEEFTDEVIKSLGVVFGEVSEGDVPEFVEKGVLEEVETRLKDEIEEVRKAIPTIPDFPEIPEIPEDQSEKVKALEALVSDLETRLKALEDASTGEAETTPTPEEEEEDEEDTNKAKSKGDEPYSVWK